LRVSGVVTPEAVKSEPAMEMPEMVTGAVPVEDNVTGRVAVCPTVTLPKLRLAGLRVKVEVAAFSCNAKVLLVLAAVAVRVAVCAEVTAEDVAVKAALVALAGTVTVAGTVTAVLLLERLTLRPPVGAAALRVTVQASVPAPVMDALLQESAASVADETPVPVKPITAAELVEELLAMDNCPVAAPVTVGSNSTSSVVVWPGARLTGKVAPAIVNPVPVSVAALTVTGAVPVEVRVRDCVAVAFNTTFPNDTLAALMPSAGE
jgi:hypothetical protein